jgi:hypothetical protein
MLYLGYEKPCKGVLGMKCSMRVKSVVIGAVLAAIKEYIEKYGLTKYAMKSA